MGSSKILQLEQELFFLPILVLFNTILQMKKIFSNLALFSCVHAYGMTYEGITPYALCDCMTRWHLPCHVDLVTPDLLAHLLKKSRQF
jgi:hypothetical protein